MEKDTSTFNATKISSSLLPLSSFVFVKDSVDSIKSRIDDGCNFLTLNVLESYRTENNTFKNKATEKTIHIDQLKVLQSVVLIKECKYSFEEAHKDDLNLAMGGING